MDQIIKSFINMKCRSNNLCYICTCAKIAHDFWIQIK